jgi:hypothetical protein
MTTNLYLVALSLPVLFVCYAAYRLHVLAVSLTF